MNTGELDSFYRDYIACLNQQDWAKLGRFVHDDVRHNGRQLGLQGYQAMLERDFAQIPDLRFDVQIIISQLPLLGSRIRFDVTPKGEFLGLPVNGRRIAFTENVFYEIRAMKIYQVWSIVDKAAIEAQLRDQADAAVP
jgi:predicted ester cyclase